MQEKSNPNPEKALSALEFKELKDEFATMWPAEWQNLPRATESVHQYGDKIAPAVFLGKKCKGDVPTPEEIAELRDACVADGRKPVAMLGSLGYVRVVDFPEGEDPTVKEFFEHWEHKLKNAKTVAMLVIYPCLEG